MDFDWQQANYRRRPRIVQQRPYQQRQFQQRQPYHRQSHHHADRNHHQHQYQRRHYEPTHHQPRRQSTRQPTRQPTRQHTRQPTRQPKNHSTLKEEEPYVKLFFQVLQCLHHIATLKLQAEGQLAYTFRRKLNDLDSFIRPAMKTSAVDDRIQAINRSWLSDVTRCLLGHYKLQLDEKLGAIRARCFSKPAVDRLMSHAISWARRSYHQRLTQEVINRFYDVVKATTQPKETARQPAPPATPAVTNSTTTRFEFPALTRTPKRPRNSSPEDNCDKRTRRGETPPTNSTSPIFPIISDSPTNIDRDISSFLNGVPSPTLPMSVKPTPTRRTTTKPATPPKTPTTKPRTPTSVKPGPKFTKTKRPVYHRTDDKSTWQFPKSQRSTLFIGCSQVNRITNNNQGYEIHSFPGAKIYHFINMVSEYTSDLMPSTMVFHFGTNDRNKEGTQIFQEAKELANVLREVFPTTSIFFTSVPISSKLSPDQRCNLLEYNRSLSSHGIPGIQILQSVSSFTPLQDDIHWTEEVANTTYADWIQQLESLN